MPAETFHSILEISFPADFMSDATFSTSSIALMSSLTASNFLLPTISFAAICISSMERAISPKCLSNDAFFACLEDTSIAVPMAAMVPTAAVIPITVHPPLPNSVSDVVRFDTPLATLFPTTAVPIPAIVPAITSGLSNIHSPTLRRGSAKSVIASPASLISLTAVGNPVLKLSEKSPIHSVAP